MNKGRLHHLKGLMRVIGTSTSRPHRRVIRVIRIIRLNMRTKNKRNGLPPRTIRILRPTADHSLNKVKANTSTLATISATSFISRHPTVTSTGDLNKAVTRANNTPNTLAKIRRCKVFMYVRELLHLIVLNRISPRSSANALPRLQLGIRVVNVTLRVKRARTYSRTRETRIVQYNKVAYLRDRVGIHGAKPIVLRGSFSMLLNSPRLNFATTNISSRISFTFVRNSKCPSSNLQKRPRPSRILLSLRENLANQHGTLTVRVGTRERHLARTMASHALLPAGPLLCEVPRTSCVHLTITDDAVPLSSTGTHVSSINSLSHAGAVRYVSVVSTIQVA